DMDALPMPEETGLPFASEVSGAMHACGHDAHTAMLVGAARLLARRRDSLAGSVLFMLQPGEEGYHGARVMIEEGLLDGAAQPTGAFALHVTHRMTAGSISARPGPAMASGDTLQIVVRGKGGHASAPHDCLDPIPIACEIVQAFQTLVTRRVHVFDPAVVTVAKPEAGPAASHPIMASEDLSYVLQKVPGAIANLSTRPNASQAFPNHSPRMLVNESALTNGIAMHLAVALRFLEKTADPARSEGQA